ncbi:MAG: hypothetical protein H3C34_23750 [Caldilineaceae bacterium]|nr:hypothetical protein [Caldilineaceae bacterium]
MAVSRESRAELFRMLSGGDRRSIGRVDEVMATVEATPELYALLLDGLQHTDPIVRMRAADAAEKLSAVHPGWLQPHKTLLFDLASGSGQQEVRWHLALMLPRLSLTQEERRLAASIMEGYLEDKSAIVRANALEGMAALAVQDMALRAPVLKQLESALQSPSAAVRSRARRLLQWLTK